MAEIESYHSEWAAQFFAAAELSRRGYTVTLTLGNARATDLIAREGARADNPAIVAKPGGTGHRVSRRRVGRSRRNDASTSRRKCLRVHSAL